MTRKISFPAWIRRPDVLDYIIESYAGVEKFRNKPGPGRRVFLWEEHNVVYMGNCEAFLEHLAKRFELILTSAATTYIHQLLRSLGETVYQPSRERATRRMDRHSFKQPEPEQWIVKTTPREPRVLREN